MRSLLYSNLFARKPAADVAGTAYSFPKAFAGEQWTLALRFTDKVDGEFSETFPDIRSLRATMGYADKRPVSGTVKLQVGDGASTIANTTPAFPWGITAEDLAAKLNALAGFAGADFTVDWDSGSYLIARASGAEVKITPRANRLKPIAMVRARSYQVDDEWITDVRFVQAPLAFTDTAEQVLPQQPYIETVVDGYTDGSGTYKQNEVQKIILPPEFRGQYYLRRGTNRTTLLSLDDGPEEVQATLNEMLALEDGIALVTNPDDGEFRIEFGGDLGGVDLAPLEVVVPVEGTPPGDWTFTLDFDRNEIWSALREKEALDLTFEAWAEIYLDPEDHATGTKVIRLWQEKVAIGFPVWYDGLAEARTIDWQRPASPRDYRKFSPSTLITGQQHFRDVFGDGASTEFTFDHNLGTTDLSGLVISDATTGRIFRDNEFTVTTDTTAAITVDFGDTTLGANAAKIVLTSAGPRSAFVDGLEIEIDQVIGLQDIIDDFGGRIAELETYIPSTGPGATSSSTKGLETKLPLTKETLFWGEEDPFGDEGFDPVKLAAAAYKPPYLLPAIHDATATIWADSTSADLVDPEASGNMVFLNSSGATIDVGGGGRVAPRVLVKSGGYAGCDGRMLYAVYRDGSTNSYYPAAFERVLFTLPINEKQFRLGRKLQVQFAVELALAKAECQGQWVITMDFGYPAADSTPSPVGLNLQSIAWATAPIFRQAIVVTSLPVKHSFGVSISRGTLGFTLDQRIYDWEGNNAAAPTGANFVLRARLAQWDTENNTPLARGWLGYRITDPPDAKAVATIT